ncbi:hypothetical protein, partial [Komagataeibacter rhaeticus]|uniref:hypothetical protein n=1 Tax=Komagataeibacter rhaeticus TaxID=215221 RepID=UPI00222E65B7
SGRVGGLLREGNIPEATRWLHHDCPGHGRKIALNTGEVHFIHYCKYLFIKTKMFVIPHIIFQY